MSKSEIIKALTKLVENGVSKRQIEEDCNLPKNALSSVLKKTKAMPAKWIPILTSYLSLKETLSATPAPTIPVEEKTIKTKTVKSKWSVEKAPTDGIEVFIDPSVEEREKIAELIKKLDALEEKCLLLVRTNHTLEQAVIILKADKLALEDQVSQLRKKAGKGPSLADILNHDTKPFNDPAANLRAIKSGKGGKNGEK